VAAADQNYTAEKILDRARSKITFTRVLRGEGSMRRVLVAVAALAIGLLAITSSGVRGAGSNAAEEAAISKLIAVADAATGASAVPHLADDVFWSGAIRRPIVGNEKSTPRDIPTSPANQVLESRKAKTEPIRIVIADSRDLAYEYSKFTLDYDLKSGQHITGRAGYCGYGRSKAANGK
jgi:hypothetical protein